MKKKRRFGINVGTSSIMLIFVILCLVSFATLSIVSAKVDYDLSKKLAERTTTYYSACNEGEEFLIYFDNELRNAYNSSTDEIDYFNKVGTKKGFSIEISDYQTLDIQIVLIVSKKAYKGIWKAF